MAGRLNYVLLFVIVIDVENMKDILDRLTEVAKNSVRLRMHYDLRTSLADGSQRMLNALEPGTEVPVHRHVDTTEVVCVLRGAIREQFYDDDKKLVSEQTVCACGDAPIVLVPQGMWHSTVSLESGTIIFEAKDGAYQPPQCPCDTTR